MLIDNCWENGGSGCVLNIGKDIVGLDVFTSLVVTLGSSELVLPGLELLSIVDSGDVLDTEVKLSCPGEAEFEGITF